MNANNSPEMRERNTNMEDIRQPTSTNGIQTVKHGFSMTREPPSEMVQQIWDRRAAQLAQAPVEEQETEKIRLVLIRLGREIYGLEARYVFAIKPADLITRVPRVPDWVAGVVNLRGHIMSVVDLRSFFGLPRAERDAAGDTESSEKTPHMLVVETADMEVVLLADEVLTVETWPISQVQDTFSTARKLHPEYVQGVITQGNKDSDTDENGSTLVILDLPALLADERLIVHEEVI
jgi:purine-binding chemotaxis protein CheW